MSHAGLPKGHTSVESRMGASTDFEAPPRFPSPLINRVTLPARRAHTPVDRIRKSLVGELRVPAPVSSLSMQPPPLSGRVGVRITTFEASEASYALRPAELLVYHTEALSRGSTLAGFPTRAPATKIEPTTISMGGSVPHW